MKKFILSIDQGTTSTRAILFDKDCKARHQSQREITCLFPHSGWVEQDAIEIWISVIDVVNEVLVKANISMKDIDSIGITNQRETAVVWDKNTGLPIYNAIVWQSRQSSGICEALSEHKELIHKKTGLLMNPYFSASKIKFILDHVEGAKTKAMNGDLLFGTIDSWLIYKMSKGKVHACDVSNASRTLLYNINDLKWDEELCELFDIPMTMLPKVFPSSYKYSTASFFDENVCICGVAGDQQSALFGQACFEKGESKNTYGTGCFMLLNIGDKPLLSKKGLLTTIAWQIGNNITYALEGSVFIGGALIQWLRDEMGLISSASESEKKALKVHDSNGIYIVPAFTGLGTPYWDNDARGAVFGLTRNANKYHFIRASLEAIAYQCKDVIEVMKEEAGLNINNLRVDGGATQNNYLLEFQSNILSTTIEVPECLETTALGVAYLAGLCSGYYQSIESIKRKSIYQKTYKPSMKKSEAIKHYRGWKKAVKATRMFKN
jgi:glycerol kinase